MRLCLLLVLTTFCFSTCLRPIESQPGPEHKVVLSKNFVQSEFACSHCGQVEVDPVLVESLQQLRDIVKRPVIITSGYRCEVHNRAVGGASHSLHLVGKAADIQVPGLSIADVITAAKKVPAFKHGGIGATPNRGYVHVDIRDKPYHWNDTSQPSPQP